jgi:hypothetical protein
VAAKKAPNHAASEEKTPARTVAIDTVEPTQAELALSPQNPPEVAAILLAVPTLQSGQAQSLAAVAKALLDAKLRGKNMTATKLLKKFPHYFVLLPTEKPSTVTYTPAQDVPWAP